jgi:hypothetical protein
VRAQLAEAIDRNSKALCTAIMNVMHGATSAPFIRTEVHRYRPIRTA